MLLRTSKFAALCARSASSSLVRPACAPRICPLRRPFAVRAMSSEVEAAQKAAAAQQCAQQVAPACLTMSMCHVHVLSSAH